MRLGTGCGSRALLAFVLGTLVAFSTAHLVGERFHIFRSYLRRCAVIRGGDVMLRFSRRSMKSELVISQSN